MTFLTFWRLVTWCCLTVGLARCGGSHPAGESAAINELGPKISGVGGEEKTNNTSSGGTGEFFGGDLDFFFRLAGIDPVFFGTLTRIEPLPAVVSENNFPQLGNGDFTVSFVMRPGRQMDLQGQTNLLIGKSGGGVTFPFQCELYNANSRAQGKIVCSWQGQGGSFRGQSLTSPKRLDDGRLHFIVFSLRGDDLFLQIDGLVAASARLPAGTSRDASNALPISVAGLGSTQRYVGELLQVAVFDRSFADNDLLAYFSQVAQGLGL